MQSSVFLGVTSKKVDTGWVLDADFSFSKGRWVLDADFSFSMGPSPQNSTITHQMGSGCGFTVQKAFPGVRHVKTVNTRCVLNVDLNVRHVSSMASPMRCRLFDAWTMGPTRERPQGSSRIAGAR